MPYTLSALDTGLLLIGAAIVIQLIRKPGRPPKPPGPKGYPIVGNLFDLPSSHEWETFSKWGDIYGDFMSASVFGTTIVVVNSYKRAMEIFDDGRKTIIYSSRPYVAMTGDLCGFGDSIGLLPYGPKLRNGRKFFHKELGRSDRVVGFYPQEEEQAKTFIRRVLNAPDDLLEHTFHHSAAIILRIAYGYEVEDANDHMVHIGNKSMEAFNQSLLPGKFLCNQIPALRHVPSWMPGAGFKNLAVEWRKLYRDMVEVPFNYVKDEMATGTAEESFCAKWLKTSLSPNDREELMHAAGAMFGAGGETTAVTLYFFYMVLAQHPEVQTRARAEIDSAVGRDRMPTFGDKDKMPYLDALTKEVLRCHPVVPMCLPHATLEDDIHDGYFVPKGSIVMANIWKMCNDPEVYKNPEVFNPDRFLGESPEADPRLVVFGFGRRVCPGRLLADASLFITHAMILWSFDVSSIEVNGKPIPPVYRAVSGVVSHVEPVKLNIAPRMENLAQLLI